MIHIAWKIQVSKSEFQVHVFGNVQSNVSLMHSSKDI